VNQVEIIAEQNSPSDEKIIIHEILVNNGDNVVKDQVIFLAEGAKSLFDIVSPVDGEVFNIQIKSGEFSEIGQVLAIIKF
jgi:biotin carboxyl carrier protein